MSSLLAAGGLTRSGFCHGGSGVLRQMLIGGAIGIPGRPDHGDLIRRVSLPSEGSLPAAHPRREFDALRLTTLAHGSGFLAVFIAGIVVGDAPHRPASRR